MKSVCRRGARPQSKHCREVAFSWGAGVADYPGRTAVRQRRCLPGERPGADLQKGAGGLESAGNVHVILPGPRGGRFELGLDREPLRHKGDFYSPMCPV